LTDSYRHKGMRKRLVESLRKKGIRDETVLHAMETVPRHYFLDKAFEEHAYEDKPFPIGHEQSISQPFTVAFQSEILKVQKRHKVLEIGTGSGYQAAILGRMGARVYTVERYEALFHKAKALLAQLHLSNVRCFYRDGSKGLPEFAPFDRILATAGAREIPESLKQQLTIGGILVIPVGEDFQHMLRITRLSETEYNLEDLGDFRFVPFLEGVEPD
jgi:protein-L-isoaspartate(D-aspartate) O-methyltransferase